MGIATDVVIVVVVEYSPVETGTVEFRVKLGVDSGVAVEKVPVRWPEVLERGEVALTEGAGYPLLPVPIGVDGE